MYRIKETNGAEYLADNIRFVELSPNGCYVAAKGEPKGFSALVIVETEDGPTFQNKVFALPNKTLNGTEPEATYEDADSISEAQTLTSALEQAYELLYGGLNNE